MPLKALIVGEAACLLVSERNLAHTVQIDNSVIFAKITKKNRALPSLVDLKQILRRLLLQLLKYPATGFVSRMESTKHV